VENPNAGFKEVIAFSPIGSNGATGATGFTKVSVECGRYLYPIFIVIINLQVIIELRQIFCLFLVRPLA